MKFGLYINPSCHSNYDDIINQAILADQLAFDSVWLTEKHFDQGHLLWSSPLMTASYLAAKTHRIKIGFAACVSTLYHPVRLAENFANLDVLSKGRVIIGLTRSSLSEHTHDVFQSPVTQARTKFNEQFEIMKALWEGSFHAFNGQFYTIPHTQLYPAVIQKPVPPIFFIGSSDDSIINASRHGVGIFLHAFQDIDSILAKKALYEKHFDDVLGLGPRIVLSRFIYVGDSNEQAISDIGDPFMHFLNDHVPHVKALLEKQHNTKLDLNLLEKFGLFGDAEYCMRKLETIRSETGIYEFTFIFNLITLPYQKSILSMQKFANTMQAIIRS